MRSFVALVKTFHSKLLFLNSLTCIITGVPFPKTFIPICKKVLTRLYRVFVHIYIHHFDKLVALGAVSDNTIISGCGSTAAVTGSSRQLVLQTLLLFCGGV